MAISFTNGSYFFPLLYAIFSSSCYLQHVQSSLATASWIDHSMLTINKNHWLTPKTARFIWDPGGIAVDVIDRPPVLLPSIGSMSPIDLTRAPTVKTASTMSTDFLLLDAWSLLSTLRQWDPGIPTLSTRLRRQWDPGIAKDGIDRSFYGTAVAYPVLSMEQLPVRHDGVDQVQVPSLFQHCHRPPAPLHPSIGSMSPTMSLVEFHPDIASSASVFHHCHPVLSRPTVPNIDT